MRPSQSFEIESVRITQYNVLELIYLWYLPVRAANSYNLRARGKGILFFLLGLLLPAILLVNFLASTVSNDVLVTTLGQEGTDTLKLYLVSGG